MITKPAAYVLVFLQFVTIFSIVITSSVIPINILYFFMYSAGIFLGVWSLWEMRKSKFQILPHVKHGSRLVTTGPYKYVRHPMYLAILLICTALVLDSFSPWKLMTLIMLAVVMIKKIEYEERLLATHFEKYADYKRKTPSMIPSLR